MSAFIVTYLMFYLLQEMGKIIYYIKKIKRNICFLLFLCVYLNKQT